MADGFSKFRKGIKLDPQATTPSNPEEGDIFRSDGSVLAKGVWEYRDGSWQTLGGSGQGGINYLEGDNTDFENGVGDWTEYADAAGTEPVDGTGGSATNHSFAQTGSTPLRGTASGLMTYATASSAQGEGVSCAFTIDEADKTQKLTISFDYDGSNSNYNDGDIRVFVYDVTNSNLIRVNGEDVKAGKGTHYAQFQAAADSTSYRLILHIATSAVGLTQFKFDNVSVGPTKLAMGAIITDWIDFTPTGSWTTNTTYTGKWRRVGDVLEVNGNILLSGAPDSTSLHVNLPSGLTIDTDKIVENAVSGQPVGQVAISDSGGNLFHGRCLKVNASDSYIKMYEFADSGTNEIFTVVNQVSPITFASGDEVNFSFKVPIQGWSSNAAMSEDLGGRDVVAEGAGNGGGAITANVTDIDFTETRDTSDSFDGTIFTAPESGDYDFNGFIRFTAGVSAAIYNYIDGVQDKRVGTAGASSSSHEINGSVYLEKGQQLSFRSNVGATLNNVTTDHHIHIQKLNSGKTALETETVAARYTSDSGQTVTAGSPIIYEDIDYDTHNAYNISTGVYTVPVSGKYLVKGQMRGSTSNSYTIGIDINGTTLVRMGKSDAGDNQTAQVIAIVDVSKGDTIEITNAGGSSETLGASALDTAMDIARLK
jgi:hypothetical protein